MSYFNDFSSKLAHLVRSTGIEPVDNSLNPLIYKAFWATGTKQAPNLTTFYSRSQFAKKGLTCAFFKIVVIFAKLLFIITFCEYENIKKN